MASNWSQSSLKLCLLSNATHRGTFACMHACMPVQCFSGWSPSPSPAFRTGMIVILFAWHNLLLKVDDKDDSAVQLWPSFSHETSMSNLISPSPRAASFLIACSFRRKWCSTRKTTAHNSQLLVFLWGTGWEVGLGFSRHFSWQFAHFIALPLVVLLKDDMHELGWCDRDVKRESQCSPIIHVLLCHRNSKKKFQLGWARTVQCPH